MTSSGVTKFPLMTVLEGSLPTVTVVAAHPDGTRKRIRRAIPKDQQERRGTVNRHVRRLELRGMAAS
jgi:hypothetical protein